MDGWELMLAKAVSPKISKTITLKSISFGMFWTVFFGKEQVLQSNDWTTKSF